MESSVEKADKVLIILTPNYKNKSDSRKSGVGFEYSLISAGLFQTQTDNTKFIPILRNGNNQESIPGFLKTLIYHDMTDDKRFNSDFHKLLRIIYENQRHQNLL